MIAAISGDIVGFYNSKRALFFKICSHIFLIFEVKLEQFFWSRRNKVERKSEWLCGEKFFHSNFKVELENGG